MGLEDGDQRQTSDRAQYGLEGFGKLRRLARERVKLVIKTGQTDNIEGCVAEVGKNVNASEGRRLRVRCRGK